MAYNKNKIANVLCIGFMLTGMTSIADAALVSRLGGLAVYDTDLNITWLADANAGAGSAFDDGFSTTDGRMTWTNATAWANNLTVGGFTDWRLPTMGSTCVSAVNCPDNEMGHLFYNELGGIFAQPILTSVDPDLALFSNIQTAPYFSDTELTSNPGIVWSFNFNSGDLFLELKTFSHFAWAVRSGDVSAVPVPAAVWLFATGLIGMLSIYRRKVH